MTKEELEKDFDEKFFVNNWNIPVKEYVEIKNHIFNELIPTVLKDILPKEKLYILKWYDEAIKEIKQKAKEKFNIII